MAKSRKVSGAKAASNAGFGSRTHMIVTVVSIAVLIVALWFGHKAATATMNTFSPSAHKAKMDIALANPNANHVYVFELLAGAGQTPQMLAELGRGGETKQQARVGQVFLFSTSKSGATRDQIVPVEPGLARYEFVPNCKDIAETATCQSFQKNGACATHPGWMSTQCALSCNMCHLLNQRARCDRGRLNVSLQPAVGPGDIERMFVSLQERFPNNNVKIHSREPDGLWVATFDNFVTAAESKVLISTTAKGMRRSTDQGQIDPTTGIQSQVTSQTRTSRNSWCGDGCSDHPTVVKLIRRISEVVGIPEDNFESPQVLEYSVGQYYRAHQDASASDLKLLSGQRLYTMFLYFDEVEAGGETHFPKLNLTISPAKGRALLWPSVRNDDPSQMDSRSSHSAEPVILGVKRSANVWVHQYNYKVPNMWGCTGSIEGVAGENR